MPIFTDQLQQEVRVPSAPQRIISLVPSQTELLHSLGLEEQVVGITKFCIHPLHWHETKTIIGGTKNFNFERIDQLQPDLILGNKEENYQEGIEKLKQHYPVWMSDITDLDDALRMIHSVGQMVGRSKQASDLEVRIVKKFKDLPHFSGERVLYFIWRHPWMLAGKHTFIDSMLSIAGLENVIQQNRYPHYSSEELQAYQPDLVFLSSEPYPFQKRHVVEVQALFPTAKVLLVEGEFFSWYGNRVELFPSYSKKLKAQVNTNAS